MKYLDAIEWPNGEGFTPCTIEYATLVDEAEAIKPDYINMDQLSAEDYQLWNTIQDKLRALQASNHLGKGQRY